MLIYQSTSNIKSIIETNETEIFGKVEIKEVSIFGINFGLRLDNDFLKAVLVLQQNNLLHDLRTSEDIKEKHYYELEGEMLYKSLKEGDIRISYNEQDITQNTFFEDDILIFGVQPLNFYRDICFELELTASRIRVFDSIKIKGIDNSVYKANSADTGILFKKKKIKTIFRVNRYDENNGVVRGVPLMINEVDDHD